MGGGGVNSLHRATGEGVHSRADVSFDCPELGTTCQVSGTRWQVLDKHQIPSGAPAGLRLHVLTLPILPILPILAHPRRRPDQEQGVHCPLCVSLLQELPDWTVSQSGGTVLHPPLGKHGGSTFSESSAARVSVCLLILDIRVGVRRHLTIALVCLSLMASGVKPLFMCFLAICVSSLEKCLFKS